ncbi:hypothetical protein DL765_006256 [Monosporascus sp. GIB2]|nr:hypothetical protein DL765_006256 [Monosporascus sp. GIB2]
MSISSTKSVKCRCRLDRLASHTYNPDNASSLAESAHDALRMQINSGELWWSGSGSGVDTGPPGTTTRLPFVGYDHKPTTTREVKDVETPPGDSASAGTSTPRGVPMTAPETTATPTPGPSRHTPAASSEVTSDSDGSEPRELRTCDIRDVKTVPRESTAASPASSTAAVATGGIS